uniref:Ubiquitin carboxyl-terminal hydrolase n=1 Tax=Cyprinus carpio TaxID=7962 RepID=A0A8C2IWZ3_CYPCA
MSNLSSVVFSEAPSQMPSADSTALQAGASVNQVEKDIKKMNIKDPVDRSSVSHTLNETPTTEPRQTNRDPCSYRGLLNQGATCYLNATLQVLFMTPAFRDKVLLLDTREKLKSALKELFKELRKQDRGDRSVSTKGVIQALGIETVYEQQDAVEYFLDILEKVGPDLAEVFRGTMRNHRTCSENHKSHDDSSFKSLQIALNSRDGTYRLEDGIQSYFASTELVGDDQMYCEDCDEKRDTIWSCDIHEYPAILPLHLKRFVYDRWSRGFVKNDCPMDVPLQLPLRFQEQEQQYSLYAVINHRGSRHGGHYTAHIRSSEENKWYCFDDSRVTQVDESKLKGSSEAYLLLYQKTSSAARVEDVKEEPRMHTAEAGDAVDAGGAESGRAHNKPQLEVSAMTLPGLRILVLGSPETDRKTLAEMIVREVGFSKSQLQHGKTIKDSLKMCSPGPHMVLWVAPLGNDKKDIKAFEEIYRFLGSTASKYIMIVFTSKGHPTESIKNEMRKYVRIKKNHVLDIHADLNLQVKELVSKLRKTVHQNHKDNRPYYVKKTQKIKHKKTHKSERARKRQLCSNPRETEKREKSTRGAECTRGLLSTNCCSAL